MDEIQSKYGYTEVLESDFTDYAEEDRLYKKLMTLYESFKEDSAWIQAKWERNRRMFMAQGLGIPIGYTLTKDDFNPLNQRLSSAERKPMTSTPILYSTYENLVSDAIEMQPEAVFLGRSEDDGQKADEMTAIVRCLLERRNFKATYNEWVRVRSQYGMAIIETTWDDEADYNEGDVDICVWSPQSILLDPLYENIQDGRAVFKTTYHHASWFKEHYPDKVSRMTEANDILDEFNTYVPDKVSKTIPLIEAWCRRYDAKKKRYSIHMYKLAGGVVLENSEKMEGSKDGMYAHGQYPFVVSYYEQIQNTPWGLGPLDYLSPVQEYISQMDDMILQNIKASARPRVYFTSASGVTAEQLHDMDNEFIEVRGSNLDCVKWETGQPFNAAALQMYMSKTETLKTESGQNAASRGEVPGSVTAASAISMLQSAGSKRANLSQYGLNNSFAKVVRQLVSNMIQFYTKKRVFRLRGKLIESEEVYVFDPKEYRKKSHEWEYDLEIRIQRESTFHTAYTNQTILSLLSMGAIDATDAISLLDIPNHDAIKLAVERNNQIKQTLSALTQEVQNLRAQAGAAAQENQQLLQAAQEAQQPLEDAETIAEGNPMFQQVAG